MTCFSAQHWLHHRSLDRWHVFSRASDHGWIDIRYLIAQQSFFFIIISIIILLREPHEYIWTFCDNKSTDIAILGISVVILNPRPPTHFFFFFFARANTVVYLSLLIHHCLPVICFISQIIRSHGQVVSILGAAQILRVFRQVHKNSYELWMVE